MEQQDRVERRLGKATISPEGDVVAGAVGTWEIRLVVGSAGVDEGGTIKIAQRFASDWEPAQFEKPLEGGYTTVRLKAVDPSAKVRARWDRKGHDRPWMNCIVLDVYDGSLAPGDEVVVVIGDRTGGGPGSRAQSFQETRHEFRVMVDPTNACRPRPIAKSPIVKVIAGEAVEVVCTVPTQAQIGKAVRVHLKGHDKWGNPTEAPKGLKLKWEGSGEVEIRGTELVFKSPGSGRVVGEGFASNPSTGFVTLPPYRKYWGDLHAQSDATVGTGTEEEYFAFARDVAALDFCSHQGNDFQVRDEDWKKLNDVVRAFHKDHSFVAFPGWEWSGNSTVGGDRNVWFLEEGMPIFRSSHWQVSEPEDDWSPADTAADLFERARRLPREKVLLGSHVGGRFADIRLYFDEELGPLVELVSCWGVFEWMLWDAFEKGYVVGIMCSSDGHKGRPGAEGPGAGQFGIPNGLTCVLAEEQTREAIFKALKARRCYGTTGARMDLAFTAGEKVMGEVWEGAPEVVMLRASVKGTAPIEAVEFYEGRQVVHTWRPGEFGVVARSRRVRVSWKGSRIRGRGRRANWDGSIRVEGAAKIVGVEAHFDTPIDRITSWDEREVKFISQTTGDTDWIDLDFENPPTAEKLVFESKVGRKEIEFGELAPRKVFEMGGLDMELKVERYPEAMNERNAEVEVEVRPPAGKRTPYFVKVIQTDGQMAWASPIYMKR